MIPLTDKALGFGSIVIQTSLVDIIIIVRHAIFYLLSHQQAFPVSQKN
ncbi:hypothetical protein ES703_33197 [subsurface metagenome]